jgi:KGK domain
MFWAVRQCVSPNELILDKLLNLKSDFARKFHQELINSKAIETWDGSIEWFDPGYPCQLLNPGEQWQNGHFRFRIVAEFIPNEPEIEPANQPIDPSLDIFRETL